MLEDAEKFAAIDKEKRETIDLKNQAETLCSEVEKELSALKDTISLEQQENLTKLVKQIRDTIQTDDSVSLKSSVENLKEAMRELVNTKVDNESGSDSINDL